MLRIVSLVLLCSDLLVTAAFASTDLAIPAPHGAPPEVALVRADAAGVELAFELRDLDRAPVEIDGRSYEAVSIPGGAVSGAPGEPALPSYTQLVAVPEGRSARLRVEVLETEPLAGLDLAPVATSEGGAAFAAAAAPRPASGAAGGPAAELGEVARLRGLAVVPIIIRPASYDAAARTLHIARRMRLEVTFEPAATPAGAAAPRQRVIPASFDRLYQATVPNYAGPGPDQVVEPGANLVICPNDPTVVAILQPLVAWHHRQGIATTLVTMAETGSTSSAIKNYIQSVYDDPHVALEYVTLVGDAGHLPTWYENYSWYNGEGDHPYTQLDGGDILADIHIGRLSYGTTTDLERIVNKVLAYERDPYMADTSWFTRACAAGDPSISGESCVTAGQWLKERCLLDNGYTEVDTVFSGDFVTDMRTKLSRGCSLFGYRGYLGMSGWTAANAYQLTNESKMFFSVALTCDTGSFASGTSRSEAFLRAGTGTTDFDGAIGAVGTATTGTHTRYNNCMYYGVFRGILQEHLGTMGAALTRGKLEMYLNYNMAEPNTVAIWSYWNNLMGDPVVDVWTGVPRTLDVSHPASVAVGTGQVTVTVAEGAIPVEGARVCLWKEGETYVVGLTDASGVVDLPVTLGAAGTMQLTVSGHNLHPYLADVTVTGAGGLVGHAVALDDGGDGVPNPGERLGLAVELENLGAVRASDVSATLSSTDPYVTVAGAALACGTIEPGIAVRCDGSFRLAIAGDCPDGHTARLALDARAGGASWRSWIDLEVAGATTPPELPGEPRPLTDPTGPDGYGYYAFDNTDTGYPEAPTYDWVELDPAYGGAGSEVVLGDFGEYQDRSAIVDLPFTFQYYGKTYDQVTVCSNGWVALGSTYLAAYRNWTIPGAGGPNAMIAAFWDDLYQVTGSRALYEYDAIGGRFIIEWSRFRNRSNGSTETLELILLDPAVHSTPSGDGAMIMQYETVSNYDPTNGYATVGIESPDQLDGLLYTYFNQYAAGAATLAAGRAIKFTPYGAMPSGTLEGHVYNASAGNIPAGGVQVRALGPTAQTFVSGGDGAYAGALWEGVYTVTAVHASFEPDTVTGVEIREDQVTVVDFHLTDILGPTIDTTPHPHTSSTTGPYVVPVTISDYSGVASRQFFYRTNGGAFTELELVPQGGDDYQAEIPGQPYTTAIDYYVHARDTAGLESFDPPGAPTELYSFWVAPMQTVFEDQMESPAGWTIGAPDDDATTGIWVRAEPVGTEYNGYTVQPDLDHTPDPGEICFVTANGAVGGAAGDADVDGGKTTLFSPVFDLEGYEAAAVDYWLWYTNDRGN
ncbi:MAG: C25 family cysteine peptidase, partial [Candidatus Eiseniibacteriota bacterium]